MRCNLWLAPLIVMSLVKIAWSGDGTCSNGQNSLAFYLGCYQSEFKRFPKNLNELREAVDPKVPLAKLYSCPVSHKPYDYLSGKSD